MNDFMKRFCYEHRSTAVTVVVVVLAIFALFYSICKDGPGWIPSEPPVPPAPVEVTVLDSLVLVKHNTPDGQITGGGVLLLHNDSLFVLTSSMLFPEDVGGVTVTPADGILRRATVIAASKTLGLAALRVHELGTLLPYELSDDPNLPPGVEMVTGNVLTYLRKNPDWMVMNGGPYITGTPIVHQDDVVGIVVGVNSLDENQAIVAGNHALVTFANTIVEQFTTEETEDGVQEEDKGRSVQEMRQTKSGLR